MTSTRKKRSGLGIKKELKEHKFIVPSLVTTSAGLGSVVLAGGRAGFGATGVIPVVTDVAVAFQPYVVPLLAVGITPVIAHDLWKLEEHKIKPFLKKEFKLLDHEIDSVIRHVKKFKKRHPRLFYGVKRYHVKKLKKVM